MERKFDKYAAGSMLGARSLARSYGHTGEPVYKYCVGGEWTVFYPAKNPVVALARLRTARFRRWLDGIRRRLTIGTQHQILKELKHG